MDAAIRRVARPAFGYKFRYRFVGEVSEWLKELVSKTSVRATVPRVRIPPSPFGTVGVS
jgi:hypothetical protein